ncbi:synaptobrevin [Pyrrhoderma noxium]|uniref:Synaptobrevin n=1 Tax=Pyrrhoderma noxium TaxID=2282107 RepID=A0A286UDP2_9AGAM|nr:synaptobrevin [Pyrrhoderma noxium]
MSEERSVTYRVDIVYDPYVPRSNNGSGAASGGARGSGGGSSNPKVASLQKELDEATGVMQSNIQSVLGRGDTLDRLQDQTDNLAVSAQNFRKAGHKVRKNMWWKDMKMRIIIGVAVVIILIIIIVPIVNATKK